MADIDPALILVLNDVTKSTIYYFARCDWIWDDTLISGYLAVGEEGLHFIARSFVQEHTACFIEYRALGCLRIYPHTCEQLFAIEGFPGSAWNWPPGYAWLWITDSFTTLQHIKLAYRAYVMERFGLICELNTVGYREAGERSSGEINLETLLPEEVKSNFRRQIKALVVTAPFLGWLTVRIGGYDVFLPSTGFHWQSFGGGGEGCGLAYRDEVRNVTLTIDLQARKHYDWQADHNIFAIAPIAREDDFMINSDSGGGGGGGGGEEAGVRLTSAGLTGETFAGLVQDVVHALTVSFSHTFIVSDRSVIKRMNLNNDMSAWQMREIRATYDEGLLVVYIIRRSRTPPLRDGSQDIVMVAAIGEPDPEKFRELVGNEEEADEELGIQGLSPAEMAQQNLKDISLALRVSADSVTPVLTHIPQYDDLVECKGDTLLYPQSTMQWLVHRGLFKSNILELITPIFRVMVLKLLPKCLSSVRKGGPAHAAMSHMMGGGAGGFGMALGAKPSRALLQVYASAFHAVSGLPGCGGLPPREVPLFQGDSKDNHAAFGRFRDKLTRSKKAPLVPELAPPIITGKNGTVAGEGGPTLTEFVIAPIRHKAERLPKSKRKAAEAEASSPTPAPGAEEKSPTVRTISAPPPKPREPSTTARPAKMGGLLSSALNPLNGPLTTAEEEDLKVCEIGSELVYALKTGKRSAIEQDVDAYEVGAQLRALFDRVLYNAQSQVYSGVFNVSTLPVWESIRNLQTARVAKYLTTLLEGGLASGEGGLSLSALLLSLDGADDFDTEIISDMLLFMLHARSTDPRLCYGSQTTWADVVGVLVGGAFAPVVNESQTYGVDGTTHCPHLKIVELLGNYVPLAPVRIPTGAAASVDNAAFTLNASFLVSLLKNRWFDRVAVKLMKLGTESWSVEELRFKLLSLVALSSYVDDFARARAMLELIRSATLEDTGGEEGPLARVYAVPVAVNLLGYCCEKPNFGNMMLLRAALATIVGVTTSKTAATPELLALCQDQFVCEVLTQIIGAWNRVDLVIVVAAVHQVVRMSSTQSGRSRLVAAGIAPMLINMLSVLYDSRSVQMQTLCADTCLALGNLSLASAVKDVISNRLPILDFVLYAFHQLEVTADYRRILPLVKCLNRLCQIDPRLVVQVGRHTIGVVLVFMVNAESPRFVKLCLQLLNATASDTKTIAPLAADGLIPQVDDYANAYWTEDYPGLHALWESFKDTAFYEDRITFDSDPANNPNPASTPANNPAL